MIKEAEANGYDWVLVNYRGVQHQLKTGQPFNAFDWQSFEEAIQHIIDQNPSRQIFIVGSSLGGNMAANVLAES